MKPYLNIVRILIFPNCYVGIDQNASLDLLPPIYLDSCVIFRARFRRGKIAGRRKDYDPLIILSVYREETIKKQP